jgi:hypothetical protein
MDLGESGRRGAAIGCALALTGALLIAMTGGARLAIGGLTLSMRDPLRPGIAGVVLLALSLMGAPRGVGTAWSWLRSEMERWAPSGSVVAAAAVLLAGLTYGARAVGGPDSFGYVSQAYLWLGGRLRVVEPLASEVPWPYPVESVAPLSYQPAREAHAIAPRYPPGLPLLMAAADRVFGARGPYLVGPIAAAWLVLATFAIGWRLTRDSLTSALAAVFLAAAPALVFNLMAPMSDIPAAALWITALLLLTLPGVAPALGAGVAVFTAVLVRPNLAPLAAAGALAAWVWPVRQRHESPAMARMGAFLGGVFASLVVVGLLNRHLYGSLSATGYGPSSRLFSAANVAGNLARYPQWLWESEGWIVLLGLVPIAIPRLRPSWLTLRTVLPPLALLALLAIIYLPYVLFEGFWFLRFVFPAFPFLFILVGAAIAGLMRRVPAAIGVLGTIALVAIAVHGWVQFSRDLGAFAIGAGEQRFIVMADFVDRTLPSNAVVLSNLHSGAVRYYTGRAVVRYDRLAGPRLPSAVEWLRDHGYRPYILLDGAEENDFRRQFADTAGAIGRLEVPVLAEVQAPFRVRLYDPLGRGNGSPALLTLPPTPRCAGPSASWTKRPL